MTLRQAFALGTRLLGVFFLLQVAIVLPHIVLTMVYAGQEGGLGTAFVPGSDLSATLYTFLGSVLTGLALVIWAAPISGWLCLDADPERATPAVDGVQLFRCGIAVTGLAVAAFSLPRLVQALVLMRSEIDPRWLQFGGQSSPQVAAISHVLQILLGAILVRQAHAIARSVTGFWEDRAVDESTFD